jgi:hypothetical protein
MKEPNTNFVVSNLKKKINNTAKICNVFSLFCIIEAHGIHLADIKVLYIGGGGD